jgi:hypothetical protein
MEEETGPIVLLIAALIFIVDAAFLFGKADPKGTGVANVVIGVPMAIMGMYIGFSAEGNVFLMVLVSKMKRSLQKERIAVRSNFSQAPSLAR